MKVAALLLITTLTLFAQVDYERLANSAKEPGNWLTYSGEYNGHRYSRLAQIDRHNVRRLKPQWVYHLERRGTFQTSPLVVDDVMYITEPPNRVTALDTRTGKPLWKYRYDLPEDLKGCCGKVNRGLAVLDSLLYLGTLDANLIALDIRTGRVRWKQSVADHTAGYSITAAPLAVDGKVITGVAGGDFGARGFLDAYDGKTGERLWRFWTVPGPGEPGNETWAGDGWKTGGAPTWLTGSFDPSLNTLYWGTGNPFPSLNGASRLGDNLYSASLVALDVTNGALKWHFQFTPHDVRDYDATQIPVLADLRIRGRQRRVVLVANRNGFYYVLDRETGEFLVGKPYVPQNWARGLDKRGRPIVIEEAIPDSEGAVIQPGMHGATNWFSPTYSRLTGFFYVNASERKQFVRTFKHSGRPPGGQFFEGGWAGPAYEKQGAVKALRAGNGELIWEFDLHSPARAGLLSTAGGLVFSETAEGNFFALDAASGELLWRFQTGGKIRANPITYLSNGKQQVAIAAGHSLFVFGLLE